MKNKIYFFLTILCFLQSIVVVKAYLLFFTSNTIMQITLAITSLVESPDIGNRRLFSNQGFHIAFRMPQFPNNITNPPTWPGLHKVVHPSLHNQGRRRRDAGGTFTENAIDSVDYSKYSDAVDILNDLSAGVFYKAMRQLIVNSGYHESCLERTICEIAHHPLHVHHDDVLSELLEFFFTPSVHNMFDKTEKVEKEYFDEVERKGRNGEDCIKVYSDCEESFLDHFTDIIETEL